jgi:DNA adenine methylase
MTLFDVISQVKGDFLMTYENVDEVRMLAQKYCLETQPVIMRNTHHATMTELLIGRDLAWLGLE